MRTGRAPVEKALTVTCSPPYKHPQKTETVHTLDFRSVRLARITKHKREKVRGGKQGLIFINLLGAPREDREEEQRAGSQIETLNALEGEKY